MCLENPTYGILSTAGNRNRKKKKEERRKKEEKKKGGGNGLEIEKKGGKEGK